MPSAYTLALLRLSLITGVYLTYTPVYWLLLKINKPLGWRFGRHYLSAWRKCVGHKLILKGTLSTTKPTLFVANHSSYMDILVLGTFVPARFVSKDDVKKWPIMGWLATNQGTLYINRERTAIREATDTLLPHIKQKESLILFPEGTTSDGCRVLPFKSSFFDIAIKEDMTIQPISIAYAGWDGLTMPRALRKFCGWNSPDIDLFSHLWQLAQLGSVQVIVTLHPVLKARDFTSRKELAKASFEAVQTGFAQAFSTPIATQVS